MASQNNNRNASSLLQKILEGYKFVLNLIFLHSFSYSLTVLRQRGVSNRHIAVTSILLPFFSPFSSRTNTGKMIFLFSIISPVFSEIQPAPKQSNTIKRQRKGKGKKLGFRDYLMRFLEVMRGALIAAPIRLLPVM